MKPGDSLGRFCTCAIRLRFNLSCALHCTSFLSLGLYRQKFVTSISDLFHQSEFFRPLNVSLLFKCHQCVLDTRFGSQLAFLSTARQGRTVMLFNSMLPHSFRPCQQNCQQTVFEFETLGNAFTLISEFSSYRNSYIYFHW